jgi:hypothetical protein
VRQEEPLTSTHEKRGAGQHESNEHGTGHSVTKQQHRNEQPHPSTQARISRLFAATQDDAGTNDVQD